MRGARSLLLAAAVGLGATFLWPTWDTTRHPAYTAERFAVGLPGSPWATFTRYVPGGPEVGRPGVETKSGWEGGVTLLSWSWVLVPLACGALAGRRVSSDQVNSPGDRTDDDRQHHRQPEHRRHRQ